ncbi:MAG: asparagine synthase (glutamine-hydrolyzing) [Rhizobiaceae bacterium]|nr:asparagine synthase (glutamine-hydrolyzing) [Rhizobiaceae bacterium]
MCGFVGVVSPYSQDHDGDMLQRMADTIAHRGPDDSGVWTDASAGISLAHRRLSIVDLSSAGHQPMKSADGRFVMSYNGEIYNHLKLREELEQSGRNPIWNGHSDTETLLMACEVWGVERTLEKITGMFALALWDRQERALYLVRDRLGEKPLYYGWQGNCFLFGSELKALKGHKSFEGQIDRDVLALLMRHNYIPTPYSIYRGIKKLLPGTFIKLEVGDGQLSPGNLPEPIPYWSLRDVAEDGFKNPFSGSDGEAIDTLDNLLKEAVQGQMMSDVPLGAFLSGGVDSSTIVALMQALSDRQVKTFTIGFNEKQYNEAEHAKAVAKHIGTEHTELYVSPKDAMDAIPRLPTLYDEPFSDASQIPTFLVSQMTREHVTVSLSGDAGDELFGGYNRYSWVDKIWKIVRLLPQPVWRGVAGGIKSVPVKTLNTAFDYVSKFMPQRFNVALPGDKAHKLAGILASGSPDKIYWGLVSNWRQPSDLVIGSKEPSTILTDRTDWPKTRDFEHCMMYLDAMSYMPDDILTKVDRASMGVSLETRVPFLDHKVVEFAWQLPLSLKIRDGQAKWILRQVLDKYVPRELIERPKMGFGVPIDTWLRGPLKDWAENLLDENRLKQEGYFDPAPIRQKWQEHLSGQRNWQYHLWNVLMFQAWLELEK